MNALSLLIPRPNSCSGSFERAEEEDFNLLVESIETLLFTSADRPEALDRAVLSAALGELKVRWPEAYAEYAPRIAARGRVTE